ncbi:protein kinase [Pyxidicoccus fallax]|uniref:Protein kinase n=1 Tax=Pyxidicoccus fallax TaxID=394095 RepID=A0A848LG60_9BACT|nr:serine/threonine-protein kinase [Pyxidicoccus fallax]NMO14778.1 protein kinase [Pyxidicoccus fallax]NPC81664.1 protein kinase [Pyxidicoccus fallax]
MHSGDTLEGKWRLEEPLGAGGMGQVYRARDLALERSVAIKLLHEALCEDPESVARFEREARAMARLEHPHITPIHAVGQEGGRPFIVMKHLEGMSLARYLRSLPGPLPVPELLSLARQLCAGLGFIHERGCVHRDIKPGNIFLSPSGHATLLDFGILFEHRGAEATQSGVRLGTPSYMAPEQARGEPVDGRADLYSLGLVLLEAATGLPPASTCRFLGEGPQGAARAIGEQAPWLPARLVEVLVRAAALNPEQRYERAPALLTALEEAVRPGTAVPEMALTPAPVAGGADESSAVPVLPRGTRTRRLALMSVGGAGVVALLLGVLMSRAPEERPAVSMTGTPLTDPASVTLGSGSVPAQAIPDGVPGSRAQAPAASATRTPGTAPTPPPPQVVATSATPTPVSATAPPTAPSSKQPTSVKQAGPRSTTTSEQVTSRSAKPGTSRGARATLAQTSGRDSARNAQGRGEVRVVTLHQGRAVWANVSVDGKHHGATPVSLDLPVGRHSVRVERGGFAPQQREVDVSPGAKAVVRIELHE